MRPLPVMALIVCLAAPARGEKPAASRPAAEKIAPAKLAAYRKHLRAGRKLGDQKRWGEAVVELEAALVEIPLDGRALSELGWAAFAAGDHAKARRALNESVRVAGDLKVKAASLYSLGRVEEASGQKEAAIRAYATSLAYRPGNKIVLEALAAVEKASPGAAEAARELPCAKARGKLGTVCLCLARAHSGGVDEEEPPVCESDDDSQVPEPFRIVKVEVPADREELRYLLAKESDGFHVVAELDTVYNPGMAGVSEDWALDEAKIETHGGHKVLRLYENHGHVDNDRGVNESESTSDHDLTLCILSEGKSPTRCPLQLTEGHEYERDVMFDDDPDDTEKHTGLPREEAYRLAVEIDAAGTATVKLQKGVADEAARAALGPHKLW